MAKKSKFYLNFILAILIFIPCLVLFVGCSSANDEFKFKNSKFDNGIYSIVVSNDTSEYLLLDNISVNDDYTWIVAKDKYGLTSFSTKKVPLSEGDNHFYIIVMDQNENSISYQINIRRRPIYIVSFDTDNGSYVACQEVEEGSFITEPNIPTKTYYEFVGWNYDFSKPVYSNLSIKANWLINTYTIKFDSNNGVGSMPDQVVELHQYQKLQNNGYVLDGYSFKGWRYNERLYLDGEIIYDLTTKRGSTITLSVEWKANEYLIYLDLDNGINSTSETNIKVTYNENYTLPVPAKEGYIFGGRFYNNQFITDKSGSSINEYNIITDIQATAIWLTGIASPSELFSISSEGKYILLNDIDCTGAESMLNINTFNGIIDGNFKSISNLSISANLYIYDNYGIIKDIKLDNYSVNHSLVKRNRHTMSNCHI